MQTFLRTNLVFSLLFAVVFVMNFGGVFSADMMTGGDGMMHDCPYMGVATVCDMSPIEHVSQWQNMFATVVQQFTTMALLALLALAVLWNVRGKLVVPLRTEAFVHRYRYRERNFDPLRLAFARGIIHTKVY